MTTSPGLYRIHQRDRTSMQLVHYPRGTRRRPDHRRSQLMDRWKWLVVRPVLADAGLLQGDGGPVHVAEEVGAPLAALFLALGPHPRRSAAASRAVRRAATAFTLLTRDERARLHEILGRPHGLTMLQEAFGMAEE